MFVAFPSPGVLSMLQCAFPISHMPPPQCSCWKSGKRNGWKINLPQQRRNISRDSRTIYFHSPNGLCWIGLWLCVRKQSGGCNCSSLQIRQRTWHRTWYRTENLTNTHDSLPHTHTNPYPKTATAEAHEQAPTNGSDGKLTQVQCVSRSMLSTYLPRAMYFSRRRLLLLSLEAMRPCITFVLFCFVLRSVITRRNVKPFNPVCMFFWNVISHAIDGAR